MPGVEITREGTGAHRAGHVWALTIDDRYVGTYETKRQAIDAADAAARRDVGHVLTVINAVDVPDHVASQVMHLLADYDPDIYTRECDENGRAV